MWVHVCGHPRKYGRNDESQRKSLLCVQTEPTRWEAAKTEGTQSTCTGTPPSVIAATCICTAHRPHQKPTPYTQAWRELPVLWKKRHWNVCPGSIIVHVATALPVLDLIPSCTLPIRAVKPTRQEALPLLSPQAFCPRPPPPLLFTSLSSSFFLILYPASWYLILVLSWLMS